MKKSFFQMKGFPIIANLNYLISQNPKPYPTATAKVSHGTAYTKSSTAYRAGAVLYNPSKN